MRIADWFVRHFGPGPSLYEVQQDLQAMRQEWMDLQDWLNRWAAKNAKRKSRATRKMMDPDAEDVDVDVAVAENDEAAAAALAVGDHKADLRRRAFQLRQQRG